MVHGTVGAEQIVIALALHVPNEDALTAIEHYGQGMVIVRPIALLEFNGFLRLRQGAGLNGHSVGIGAVRVRN